MSGRPQNRKARADRRRRRRVLQADNDLTDTQWEALKDAWGGCAYCSAIDRALQRDCVHPIRLGGRYTVTNVVPACGSCNASKGHHEVTSWMRRRRLDESAFLTRHLDVLSRLGRRA